VRRLIAAALCLAIAAPASAQPDAPKPERDTEPELEPAPGADGGAGATREADRLFEEGRRLLDAGRAAEACPYFERSQELDPGRGTLINIAACYEAVGRLVDALRVFRDVQHQSEAAGDAPRQQTARRRIAEIEARIPHLTLEVATPRPPGFVITVDRAEVAVADWADVLVDPGMVEIVASAPGYRRFETTITIAADGSRASAQIPALPALAATDASTSPRRDRGRTRLGISIAGGGGVLVGGASVLALLARRSYHDALDDECGGDPDRCSAAGKDRTDRARTRGNIATAIGAVGLAAVAGGLYLWLTAPAEAEPLRSSQGVSLEPLPVDGGAGLALTGAF